VLELLSLFEVAIGLAPGDGTVPGETLGGLGQVFVFAQQGASQVEPFGFLGIAGASHMTYEYAYLCHKSRALSSPRTSRCFSIRGHPLKLEVIFCVQAVVAPLLPDPFTSAPASSKIRTHSSVENAAADEALTRLEQMDERKARVMELRFFGGLSVEEAAEVLKVSPQTVMRDWRLA